MADDKTTVQISVAARDKLKILAEAFKRSQTGQLEWMVDVEYEKWEKVKLLPEDVKKAKRQAAEVK